MTEITESGGAERRTAMIVLVAGACIIGLAPILVRLADAGPAAVGFWRMLFALPLLALLARRESGGRLRDLRRRGRVFSSSWPQLGPGSAAGGT